MDEENKKRVIIFSTAYLPLVGGAEVAVKEITYHLGDIHKFYLVTAKIRKGLPSYEKIGKVDVYRVGFGLNIDKYLLPFLGVFRALGVIGGGGEEKPLIWAIMASYGGIGALFLKVIRPKWPFLLTLQEGDSEAHILGRVGVFYPLWRQIFRRADYIQVISNYLKEFAVKYGARCPVEVVGNGVDLEKIKSSKIKNQNDGEKLKNKEKKKEFIILTVSRLVRKNGVDTLIRVMTNDKIQMTNSKLIIVGDGEERKNLEELVRDLRLEDKVIFAGEIKLEEVIEYYAAADVFVRLSRSEGFGNVFIEAMAAGCPVVATRVGGIVDFARDGENCLLVEPEDAAGAAKAIEKILTDGELAERLREGGLKTAEEYDWGKIAFKIGTILKNLKIKNQSEK